MGKFNSKKNIFCYSSIQYAKYLGNGTKRSGCDYIGSQAFDSFMSTKCYV